MRRTDWTAPLNIDVCTHHVPEELISFLNQNAKSDAALISLQRTKFPVGKIVKVFLGDHGITN